jgi:CBS domain-containing protein
VEVAQAIHFDPSSLVELSNGPRDRVQSPGKSSTIPQYPEAIPSWLGYGQGLKIAESDHSAWGPAMDVQELMTPNPYRLNGTDTVQHAAQQMRQHNIGALPVCEAEALRGIITDRDIVLGSVASGRVPGEGLVKDYMTANPFTIAPQTNIDAAIQLMAREQVRRLCVTEGDRVVGMLSLGDVADHMADDQKVSQALAAISAPVRGQQAGRIA